MNAHPAWMLVILGAALVIFGLVWLFAPGVPWLGRLPGDIRIENQNTRIYIPITTCLLLSALLTAIAWIVQWVSRR